MEVKHNRATDKYREGVEWRVLKVETAESRDGNDTRRL